MALASELAAALVSELAELAAEESAGGLLLDPQPEIMAAISITATKMLRTFFIKIPPYSLLSIIMENHYYPD
jgi:hypothetical protein